MSEDPTVEDIVQNFPQHASASGKKITPKISVEDTLEKIQADERKTRNVSSFVINNQQDLKKLIQNTLDAHRENVCVV